VSRGLEKRPTRSSILFRAERGEDNLILFPFVLKRKGVKSHYVRWDVESVKKGRLFRGGIISSGYCGVDYSICWVGRGIGGANLLSGKGAIQRGKRQGRKRQKETRKKPIDQILQKRSRPKTAEALEGADSRSGSKKRRKGSLGRLGA